MSSEKEENPTTFVSHRGKGSQPRDDSEHEMDVPPKETNTNGQGEVPPTTDTENCAEEGKIVSLEDILSTIPPPPPPAMTNGPGVPRLMITHMVNENFKSYAGQNILGPFQKRFSCIIGPNGSGKSNVIDSMLFVFGYRAQKIRCKKLSVLIHDSDKHKNLQSCVVEIHFQKIIDKEGDDYEVVPGSRFYISRTARKDNSSFYSINGERATFKDVGALLRGHGIDLDHNRFLILQGEVEQIAMMKPMAQNEHSEGMLEYLEDIIGSARLKKPAELLQHSYEKLNLLKSQKYFRVKAVEKEKNGLLGEKENAVEFLRMENEISKMSNQLVQYNLHIESKKLGDCLLEKKNCLQQVQNHDQTLQEVAAEMEKLNQDLKIMDGENADLTNYIDTVKEKFARFDIQDVEIREKLKHSKVKATSLEKQLVKDKTQLEEMHNMLVKSENTISEAKTHKEELEKLKNEEETKIQKIMASLKEETVGHQEEKENNEKELMELSKAVNETRSRMDLAQSELDIYLSGHTKAMAKLETARQSFESTSDKLKDRFKAVKDLQIQIPQCEQELKKDEAELEHLQQADGEAQEMVKDLRQKVEEAKSFQHSHRSRSKVLDALMGQKRSGKIPGILGRLGDLGAIDEKYDVAISSCCGALDNIVVDTIDTAQKCVVFLKTHSIGSATFIGLDKMKLWEAKMAPIPTPEDCPRVFDLVRVKDQSVRPAFYFALRDTLVAKDLTQASRVGLNGIRRWRVVTLGGQMIEMSGTMTGGGGRVMKGRMGSSIVNEISQEELERMAHRLNEKVTQLQESQARKLQLGENVQNLRQKLRNMNNTLEVYTNTMTSLAEQKAEMEPQIKELEAAVLATKPDKNKQKRLEKSLTDFTNDYEQAAKAAGKVENTVKRLHALIVDISNNKLKAQQDVLNKLNQKLDDCASVITKAQVAIKMAQRNLKKYEQKVACVQKEMEANENSMAELKKQLIAVEEDAGLTKADLDEAQAKLSEKKCEYQKVMANIDVLQQQQHGLKKHHLSMRLELEKIDAGISSQESVIAQLKSEASKLILHEIEGEPLEKLPVFQPSELENVRDLKGITSSLSKLKLKLAQKNPNLSAIEDFRKKEMLYLQRMAELEKVTKERDIYLNSYNQLCKQRLFEFMNGFNIINSKLKENYQMLTLGGDAELELVDTSDPFSEGIIFSVRPVRKTWKKIYNLSGGEKTLSSLALVFALHHYKPTPVYFMDEIDAALDFRNVSIVAHFIYEQTKNAQFIVISLRHQMFEKANRLIGIYKTLNTTKSVTIDPKAMMSNCHNAFTA